MTQYRQYLQMIDKSLLHNNEVHETYWGDSRVQAWLLTAEDGGVVSLTCVSPRKAADKPPAIFLPGMFSNRHFWISPKGVGLAAYLARQGHSCWLIERRETGQSPKRQHARAGLEELIRYDLPLVQRAVYEVHSRPACWIGHSFGGVAIALSAADHLDRGTIDALVLFAAQFEVDKSLLRWPGRLFTQGLARIAGRFPARRLGQGPEDEPVATMDDACRWTTQAQTGLTRQQTLGAIDCRVLAMVGAADTVDPPEGCERFISHMPQADTQLCIAGREHGFERDYDHPGIVVSKAAAQEIWPRVGDWLSG